MLFARTALPGPYPVDSKPIFYMITAYIEERYEDAIKYGKAYLKLVIEEKERSMEATEILNRWYEGRYNNDDIVASTRREMAKKCHVTIDTLRTWERNGIYSPHRDKNNRIRYTNHDLEKVQIIRLLRKAGFSISSLYELFHNKNEDILPSEFLIKTYKNTETTCATDEWINHLNQHIERAKASINLIRKKINPPL